MEYYAALDVGLKVTFMCVVDIQGHSCMPARWQAM
jgi:hypothetical protein